jgi:3-oxoacyl-[acyl-carrier-protein] synthase-3
VPAYLQHMAVALGEETRTLEESEGYGLLVSSAQALRDAGFDRHHVCLESTAYDLAKQAVTALGRPLDKIGAIIYSTCIPANANMGEAAAFQKSGDVKHLMVFPASRLQAELGMDRAFVLGVTQQACTGLLGALRLADLLLAGEPGLEEVLCVTADRFPEGARYEQAYNLISDGAAACIVGRKPVGYLLGTWHAMTNGAWAQASDDETVGSYFNYTHRLVGETLAKAGLGAKDIAWIVTQNMNAKAWQILSRLLGVDPARVACPTLAEAGHLISGDNVANLLRLEESGRVKAGDKLLLIMSGYGLNWQGLVLEKVP